MQIQINEKLKPFSHCPGTCFLLPCTNLYFKIFPALIKVYQNDNEIFEITIDIHAPLNDFTIQQDLERGCLIVSGKQANSIIRYVIKAENNAIVFDLKKGPSEGINISYGKNKLSLLESNPVSIPFKSLEVFPAPIHFETLSLGNNKSQNWNQIQSRLDFKEIFPLWVRLSQLTPQAVSQPKGGTTHLLDQCRDYLNNTTRKDHILDFFKNFYLAAFEVGLSPSLTDNLFHGFNLPPVEKGDPLYLLHKGCELIRSLFFDSKAKSNEILILPNLPSQFVSGRYINLICDFGVVDVEWSKGLIRRMLFKPNQNASLNFHFQSEIRSFRLKKLKSNDSIRHKANEPLSFEKDLNYFFDCFEK